VLLHDTTFTVKIHFVVFTAVRFAIHLSEHKTVQHISAVRLSSDIVVGCNTESGRRPESLARVKSF
jgi:hypothetical protein